MRPGKERASSPDQHEAPDTAIAPDDARWLNGVHRQMQPDAPSQRMAASQAAAAKRTANAMSEEERKLKDAERGRQKRAKKAAEKAAAAEAARRTLPRCVECRRNPCRCAPAPDPDDDDPGWANVCFGNDTPPRTASPDGWTPDFTWDEFIDREYARGAGEVGWYGTNWGDAMRGKSESEQQTEERARRERARKERERAAGPPPYREEARFGPRGDAAGDELFRNERAAWYERFTGCSIKGLSLQEQNTLCDVVERRFRAYTDGRATAGGSSVGSA